MYAIFVVEDLDTSISARIIEHSLEAAATSEMVASTIMDMTGAEMQGVEGQVMVAEVNDAKIQTFR